MKKNLIFLILLICVMFIMEVVYAHENQNIKVLLNHVDIMIDGEKVDMETFLYNDTTYVPLRKFAEMFEKEVIWNDKTKTINITDKKLKVDGFYTKCDDIKTALIANVNDNILDISFQMKNIDSEDITITLHYPYFDFIIYDENEYEIYRYSKNRSFITLIRDEKIYSGKEYITDCEINLNEKEFIKDKTYRIEYVISFEVKSENKKYKLIEETYFRIPNISQTE